MYRILTPRMTAPAVLLFAILSGFPRPGQGSRDPIAYTIRIPSPESHVAEIEVSIPTGKQASRMIAERFHNAIVGIAPPARCR